MKIAVATEELTGATHEAIESLVAQLQGTEIPPFAIGPASFSFIPTANNGSVPFNCSGSACTYALVGKLAIAFYTIQFDADTENPTEIYVPLPKKSGSVPTRFAVSTRQAGGSGRPGTVRIGTGATVATLVNEDNGAFYVASGYLCQFQILYYTD